MKSETDTNIQSAIIGNAGEHLAISYLLRKNLIAGLAPQNTEDFDVVVMSRTGQTLFPVQVKASTKKNWMLSNKHERPIKSLIYIFIRFSKDLMNSEMYILDSEKVAQVTKTSHAIWLKLPSSNGAPHKSTKIRNLIIDHSALTRKITSPEKYLTPHELHFIKTHSADWLEPYRDNWNLFKQK